MSSDHGVSEALDVVENNLGHFSKRDLMKLAISCLEEALTQEEEEGSGECRQCNKPIHKDYGFCDGYCLTAYNASKESRLK